MLHASYCYAKNCRVEIHFIVNSMLKIIKKPILQLQNYLLPATCVLCQTLTQRSRDLCHACEADLPWLQAACRCCGLAMPATMNSALCGTCIKQPPPFTSTVALFHYTHPIDRLLTALKFHKQLVYARLLGELLAERVRQHYGEQLPDCIVPVPLHIKRLRERGFNQALELARPVAKELKIKLDFLSCERKKQTMAQSNLPAQQRKHNLKNAFVVKRALTAKHVAILDDVMTTGHTISELSRELQTAGIKRVDVWCCARTNLPEGY